MNRALCPQALQMCKRLFQASYRHHASVAGAHRTTLLQQRLLKPIGIRYLKTSSKSDVEKAKKPKKTKKKTSKKTNDTEGNQFSAKPANITIQVVKKTDLAKFVGTGSFAGPANKQVEKSGVEKLSEEPFLLVPKKFANNALSDSGVMESIRESYLEFRQQNNEIVPKLNVEKTKNENNRRKEESLMVNFKAYIDACDYTGMHIRALKVLQGLSKRKIQNRDIGMYTSVMHMFASKGKLKRLKEVCVLLTRDKLTFTPQVYAAICECIGRRPNSQENLLQLKRYLEMATHQGITMNDILAKSKFVKDQREVVLNALHHIDPSFTPKYPEPQLAYKNPLLESLNKDIAPMRETGNNEAITGSPPYKISNAKRGFSPIQMQQYAAEQLKNETNSIVLVKNISVDEEKITEEVRVCREKLEALEKKWEKDLLNAFERYLAVAQHKMYLKKPDRVNLYPYLSLLKPEQYVNILMDELRTLGEGSCAYTATTLQLNGQIGRKVQNRYKMERLHELGIADKVLRMHTKYREILCSGDTNDNPRQLWQRINYAERGVGPDIDIPDIAWPWPVVCDVGKFLFNLVLNVIKIDADLMEREKESWTSSATVIYTTFRTRDLISREELRPHPTYMKLCQNSRREYLTFGTSLVPMLTTPIPWTSHRHGGYLTMPVDLLRVAFSSSMQYDRIEQLPSPCDLYAPLDALNQLGSIPWRVNTRILDLIIGLFNIGGSDKFHVPKPPDESEHMSDKSQFVDEFDAAMAKSNHMQEQSSAYSLWCDTLYKLSLANHFRDKPFWLPHNMDFRGRVYPIPPHLNHLSSDLSRAFLNFHQKQPLGENGLNWLKLHCINLTGLKKRDSVQNRLAYAECILEDIIDSADKPLEGRLWWLQSDEPWQTLACCMEIANAIRSPNPVEYMSCLPIHQDGSCNGLQHYAALGRDEAGAISVNLTPYDTPQDVYSSVAELVEKARVEDAQNGETIAIALDGQIKRKVIKQTVMTTVYGVTRYGARLQIEKQLKDLEDFPRPLVARAASYLTKKTFNSLGEMFTSATMIQHWLTEAARFIAMQKQEHVEWITPLGLPVVQPYLHDFKRNWKTLSVVNTQQGIVSDRFGKVNAVKQKNAFPPNFIHSLDSCHMMLTSLNCEKAGITFMSVHDCFWTHANSVPVMSQICREQFVSLHSQPILENLSNSFCEQYVGDRNLLSKSEEDIFLRLPKTGKFNLKDVLDSVYFFS